MTPSGKLVVMVAAVADNGVIGADGDIPWRIPEDFAHFKRTTLGHTLVMGRATFDSIGRPLPGRTTIVLTRDPQWTADGVLVASSLAAALTLAEDLPGDVMVVGGARVYDEASPTGRSSPRCTAPPRATPSTPTSTAPTGWRSAVSRTTATTSSGSPAPTDH